MNYIVLDGNNLLFRAYRVGPQDDLYKSIFFQMILKYINIVNDGGNVVDKIFCAWDKKLTYPSDNFRKNINPEYKGTRDPDASRDVFQDVDSVIEGLKLLGIHSVYPNCCEGDDVIGCICHEYVQPDDHCTVISADGDFLLLVRDNVDMYHVAKGVTVTQDNFIDHTGVDIDHYLLYKCIRGDTSDNVQGIRGVGHKRALKLIQSGDICEEHQQIIDTNKKIFDLRYGYTVVEKEREVILSQLDHERFINVDSFIVYCRQYNLNQLANRREHIVKTLQQPTMSINNALMKMGLVS